MRPRDMKELPNPDPHAREVSSLLGSVVDLFQTAIRPHKSLKLRWYDRVIRGIGALILLGFLLGMLYSALTHTP